MKKAAVLLLALAARAGAQTYTPPPPPPAEPEPAAAEHPALPAPPAPQPQPPPLVQPGQIGEAPVTAAGSQAATLHPTAGPWRSSLATGLVGRYGGDLVNAPYENPNPLLYFGGQADAFWSEGFGQSARLRLRLLTGGESQIYIPSDGEAEAAYMIGPRLFRFVIGRLELTRAPALGLQILAQLATLPCFEGSLSLADDTMRIYYYLSPIEGLFSWYTPHNHIPYTREWHSETASPEAATAVRLRYTVEAPPAIVLSVQGDLVKAWNQADMLLGAEASAGYHVLQQSVLFNLALRWDSYTLRGKTFATSQTFSTVSLLAMATLAF